MAPSSIYEENRGRALLLLLLLYVVPPTLIALRIIPYQYRFPLLVSVVPIMLLVKPHRSTTLQQLGITYHHFRESIVKILPLTVLLLLPLVGVYFSNTAPRIDNSSLPVFFYLFYVFVSCPFQEFAYRGYLFRLMAMLKLEKWPTIWVSAALYSYVHIIYLDVPTMLFTLFAGVLWNVHYYKYRNLASVTLSHIVLGTATILLGLI